MNEEKNLSITEDELITINTGLREYRKKINAIENNLYRKATQEASFPEMDRIQKKIDLLFKKFLKLDKK